MSVPCPDPIAIPTALAARAAIPHPRPFSFPIEVGHGEVSDVVPHLNNVRAMHWIDRAADWHGERCGHGRVALRDAGLMWFVSRHEVDYLAECHVGERLLVCTWVDSVVRVRAWRETLIIRIADGLERPVAVRARTLWVLVDLATRRPRRIPDDMTAMLDPLRHEEATCEPR